MEQEISPQTAWQNEGICYRYAEEKLNDCVLRSIYMAIVRRSFGYGKKITDRISQEDLAKVSAITSRTLRDKLKILEEMKMIKIIPPDTYIKGGGSTSCAYGPEYPTGYGYVHTVDDKKSLEKYNKYINNSGYDTKTKEPEVNEGYVYDENKQF